MFEVGKTYKTKNGQDAQTVALLRDACGQVWLIGYVYQRGFVNAMKWRKDSGVRGFEGSDEPGLDLVPHSITLDLTFEEAQTLRSLLYSHIKGPEDGPRGTLSNIGNKLGEAGVSTQGIPKLAGGTRRTIWLEKVS